MEHYHNKLLKIGVVGALLGIATPALAAGEYEAIRASCKKDLKLSASACECIVKETKDNLNDKETEFLVAAIKNDGAVIAKLQPGLSATEMGNVMNFMGVTPQNCQNQ